MIRYRLSSPAASDLVEIWVYIANDNEAAADRLINTLIQKFSKLAAHPRIGRPCNDLAPGLFRLTVANYVVFYRISQEHLEIIRILHGARDIESILQSDAAE